MSSLWRTWLIVWAIGVIVFGFVIAGGAFEATSGPISFIYESLEGPGSITYEPALRFSLGVMGAVSIGWGMTVLLVIRSIVNMGEAARPFWRAISAGLAAWFVIDSSLSIATGFGLNVVPNIALAVGYLIPMFATGNLMKSRT